VVLEAGDRFLTARAVHADPPRDGRTFRVVVPLIDLTEEYHERI
jgi:hypothetical protein